MCACRLFEAKNTTPPPNLSSPSGRPPTSEIYVLFSQLDRQVTLGPKGRNVVLERTYGSPEIVNDGVTIARDIALNDHEKNVGVKLVQEVAQKSDNRCVARLI